MTHFRVINGILLHEAVIVKPKHSVLLKKRVLTKNLTIFIKFWRFHSFFLEAFTVTSRSKTIAALRLCVLDGNGGAFTIDSSTPTLRKSKIQSNTLNVIKLLLTLNLNNLRV
jgi:hypothetical protein